MVKAKPIPIKRDKRPTGRDLLRENVMRHAIGLACDIRIYDLCADLDHLADPRDSDYLSSRRPGRPPELPPEGYVIFMGVWSRTLADRETQQLLQDPIIWEPIREELYARFPQYPRLAPGGAGPSRSMFWRWYTTIADQDGLFEQFQQLFEETYAEQSLAMGMYDPQRRDLTHPHIADQFIGDGTIGRPLFNAVEGDIQLNRHTGELEQKPFDPSSRFQHTKTEGEPERYDSAGIHHGLIHGTTGYVHETVLLSSFHVPGSDEDSEAALSVKKVKRLRALLPGSDGLMFDKAMRGKHIDQLYDEGLQTHAKVSHARGGKLKEKIIELADVRVAQEVVGQLLLVGLDGAAHVRVDIGKRQELVRLEPGKTVSRESRRADGKRFRWLKEYRVPDDPRIPKAMRGGQIRCRLDTTDEDRSKGLNRAENLRPIARGDADWPTVGGPRSRAESLNEFLKRKWPNKRIPAIGARRQQMRILAFGIGMNHMAAVAYERRTGISITGPPSVQAA